MVVWYYDHPYGACFISKLCAARVASKSSTDVMPDAPHCRFSTATRAPVPVVACASLPNTRLIIELTALSANRRLSWAVPGPATASGKEHSPQAADGVCHSSSRKCEVRRRFTLSSDPMCVPVDRGRLVKGSREAWVVWASKVPAGHYLAVFASLTAPSSGACPEHRTCILG